MPLLAVNVASLNAAYATTINENWRAAAAFIGQQALPGDVVVFEQGYLELPFDLYWHAAGAGVTLRGYPYDDGLLSAHPRTLAAASDVDRATAGAHTVWLLARDQDGGLAPDGVIGRRLRLRYRLVESRRFGGGVSAYRYTDLPIAGLSQAASWLDAGGVVIHQARAHDLVLLRGHGAAAFLRAWNTYPHAAALVERAATISASALTAATGPRTHTIWLATTVVGRGDPAGIAGDWLYHHGPQVDGFRTFGRVRLYQFAYLWKRG